MPRRNRSADSSFREEDPTAQSLLNQAEVIVRRLNDRLGKTGATHRYSVSSRPSKGASDWPSAVHAVVVPESDEERRFREAETAYWKSVDEGKPLSARELAERFGISRRQTAKIVPTSVAAPPSGDLVVKVQPVPDGVLITMARVDDEEGS